MKEEKLVKEYNKLQDKFMELNYYSIINKDNLIMKKYFKRRLDETIGRMLEITRIIPIYKIDKINETNK